jgi:hypothetical protein
MLLKFSHRNWNLHAIMEHMRVTHATGALVVMRGSNDSLGREVTLPT